MSRVRANSAEFCEVPIWIEVICLQSKHTRDGSSAISDITTRAGPERRGGRGSVCFRRRVASDAAGTAGAHGYQYDGD